MPLRYLTCSLVALLCCVSIGFSQSKEQVYAGVIFHIMKYVEWPEVGNTMTVGVLNDNQLTAALNKVAADKKIVFRNIEVVKFSDLSKLKNTNVLFVPKKMTVYLADIANSVDAKQILVISEKKGEDQDGASINFIEQSGKLRFEVYEEVFTRTDLKMSEHLKKFAIIKVKAS